MSSKFIELLPDTALETHHHRPSAEDVRLEDVLAETESYTRSRSNSSVASSSPRDSANVTSQFLGTFGNGNGHGRKGSREEEKGLNVPGKEGWRGHGHSKSTESTASSASSPKEKGDGALRRLRRFTLNAGSKA